MPARALRQIDARGHVDVTVQGQPVSIDAEGEVIRVTADEPGFTAFVRGLPDGAMSRRSVRRQATLLSRTGLRLELTREGQRVLSLGAGVRSGMVARLIGLGPVSASLRTLFQLYWLRRWNQR